MNAHEQEYVVLVDKHDRELGPMDKLAAHRQGLLHRAFSVFIFNQQGELLLQQRALDKYHSPGQWTNTCCGHPRPGEDVRIAAGRRLTEEMGLQCELAPAFHFTYRADLGDGLSEHELDHVFVGVTDRQPNPVAAEVADQRFISRAQLVDELQQCPGSFSAWFPLCVWRAWGHFEALHIPARNT